MSTLDEILAASARLTGAGVGVLFASGPPHNHVLLVHRAGEDGSWELPTAADQVGAGVYLEGPAAIGDVLLTRCDVEFRPALTKALDDFCWLTPDFALTCTATHPSAVQTIKQFSRIATRGDSHQGKQKMEARGDFVKAQTKADRVAQVFGDSAPPPLQGETLLDYRARLARPYQIYSKFKTTDLAKIGCDITVGALEDQIYNDALAEARSPTQFRAGELRRVPWRDAAGREITKYHGDPNACWDQFNPPIRLVRNFCTPGR